MSGADPTIYLVTAYRHNHIERATPVDPRLSQSRRNMCFYMVDRDGVPAGFQGRAIAEIDIDPTLQTIGRTQLAEWTFFIAELRHKFASYPMFVTSTRFYEKNRRLRGTLDDYWDDLFRLLRRYGCGYLPSYDRDFGFEDLAEYFQQNYLAMTLEGVRLIRELFDVDLLRERYISDFFCNYIGFASRREFEWYMESMWPLFDFFFDEDFNVKVDVASYIQTLNRLQQKGFRNEKPFSLLIEMASHIPFLKADRPFLGLSYNGFYEVDEKRQTGRLLQGLPAGV